MKGDITRKTFNKKKKYSGVYHQQGHVLLDSDFNEQREITKHFLRTFIKDVIGPYGAPLKNAGFKITPSKHGYRIGAGHYYVDGILCVNEKEVQSFSQPNFPLKRRSANLESPEDEGFYLVYLDVWERDITCLDDSEIREVALGGPDTATRTKIIWQVQNQRIKKRIRKKPKRCSRLFSVPLRISNGKMRAYATAPEVNGMVSTSSGYSGLENRLYRVEIHKGGTTNSSEPPTFKWSNRNGVEAAKVTEIYSNTIAIGYRQDKSANFEKEDWIEIIDDRHVLHGIAGSFVKICEIEENKIVFDPSSLLGENISEDSFPRKYNPLIRKWNGKKTPIHKVIPSDDGHHFSLENGIEIQFTKGTYRSGDYWMIPLRTQVGVLWEKDEGKPKFKQPDGIEHHYCPLALLKYQENQYTLISDCRKFFPALTKLV